MERRVDTIQIFYKKRARGEAGKWSKHREKMMRGEISFECVCSAGRALKYMDILTKGMKST